MKVNVHLITSLLAVLFCSLSIHFYKEEYLQYIISFFFIITNFYIYLFFQVIRKDNAVKNQFYFIYILSFLILLVPFYIIEFNRFLVSLLSIFLGVSFMLSTYYISNRYFDKNKNFNAKMVLIIFTNLIIIPIVLADKIDFFKIIANNSIFNSLILQFENTPFIWFIPVNFILLQFVFIFKKSNIFIKLFP